MNPEIPEERKYIEELTQEYIYLSEELDYDERYEVKGKDIYNREEINEILIKSRNLYTGKRLLRRLEILYEAIQIEIKKTAENHSGKTNEALTIYNCENNRHFLFYLEHKSRLLRYINILKEEPPVGEYERQYIQNEYKSEITIIIQKQVPTANLFEFRPYNHKYNYKIPTDSNQENNVVEQILSKEELNIKLQGLLEQIKIQIQTLQGQLTLEEAYKNHEYTFLFKRATVIHKTINGIQEYIDIQDQKGRQFSTLYTKERLIKQFKDLKDQLAKEIKRTVHQFKEETKKELTIFNVTADAEIDSKELATEKLEELQYQYYQLIKTIITHFIPKSELNEYCYLEFRRKHQRIPTVEELLEGTYNNNKEYELAKTKEKQFKDTYEEERTQESQLSEAEKAYLNKTLLALEGARNIQENDQVTQIIFPNTGLTQATQDYLLQHHTQLVLETTTTRRNPKTNNLEIIGTPIITETIGILLQTAFEQYTKIILLLENYKSEIVKELTTLETPRLKEYYKTALISISVNQGILEERIKEISTQNIEGEIQHNLMNEEQNKTLEELRRFRFNWQPISTPTRRKKTKRYPQDKDILETRELIQITDDIWETINDLINQINPTNNSRLGAILLTLEGAKSIAREFYPHVQLTGRVLVKEQEKQKNIYNNFLDNTQAQIEGTKKRLLAESPEFCKIFEDNPETRETEF
ncbi:hypothetical protein C2G38_2169535 [Gigaspora rosea]|uniref:Uncharacterized protein n=1 Tax=Gigaspora rosea TaxID=44941 RepID=A0A397VNK1_9GLOM|nr:hypothetical protein C2G38_2169535 [Gigaspora rosea]